MEIKFLPGNRYYYILFGKIEEGYLQEVSITTEGNRCSFAAYLVDEERVFNSKKEAEEYLLANEMNFMIAKINELQYEIDNNERNAKAYLQSAKEKKLELQKLQREFDKLGKSS